MKDDLTANKPTLLSEIGNLTINQILDNPNTEIIKKGNRMSIRYNSKLGIMTAELASYSTNHCELRVSSVPNKTRKIDYIENILEMKKQGMLQKDIAFELDISEPYVSYILKSHKEK